MRDPARIDPMLTALRTAWRAHPDQRLAQLVLNATSTAGAPRDFGGAFNCEDDRLLAELTAIGDAYVSPATIGSITGAVFVRVGDHEPHELGTFTLPIRTATAPVGGGVLVSSGTDRLQRAMAAFAAVLEEE